MREQFCCCCFLSVGSLRPLQTISTELSQVYVVKIWPFTPFFLEEVLLSNMRCQIYYLVCFYRWVIVSPLTTSACKNYQASVSRWSVFSHDTSEKLWNSPLFLMTTEHNMCDFFLYFFCVHTTLLCSSEILIAWPHCQGETHWGQYATVFRQSSYCRCLVDSTYFLFLFFLCPLVPDMLSQICNLCLFLSNQVKNTSSGGKKKPCHLRRSQPLTQFCIF